MCHVSACIATLQIGPPHMIANFLGNVSKLANLALT